MFPDVFWMVSKVCCTSSSLETSQLRAIWSAREQTQNVRKNKPLKGFALAKNENAIMTVEPCTSQLFSVLTLNLIATVVNHIFKAPTSQAVFQPKEKANFGTYFHAGRPRRCGLRLYSWRQQPACSPFEPAGGTRPSRCPWSPHTPRPAWT